MQSNDIRITEIQSTNDLELLEIIRLYNRAFPKKIEIAYACLANSIAQYISLSNALKSCHYSVEKVILNSLPRLEARRVKLNEYLQGMITALDSGTVQDYEKIALLSSEAASVVQRISLTKQSKINEKFFDESTRANMLRQKVAEQINEIKEQLLNINLLDQNGQKRIDGLEIREEHFKAIDGLPILPQKNIFIKACWKLILI